MRLNSVQQKYRKDVVLAAIFGFSHLKVKDTKDRMLSDRFEFSTPKLCKNKREKRKKCALKCRAKFNVSFFSPGLLHTFSKKAAIFSRYIYAM